MIFEDLIELQKTFAIKFMETGAHELDVSLSIISGVTGAKAVIAIDDETGTAKVTLFFNKSVQQFLMERLSCPPAVADKLISAAKKVIEAGGDPVEVNQMMLGISPDYVFTKL